MKIWTFFIGFLLVYSLKAQVESLEINPSYGRIFKHSPAFRPNLTENSQGLFISYIRRPQKGYSFFQKFNYPSIGFNLIYNHYGDQAIFGSSLALTSSLNYYLFEKKRYNLIISAGVGLGLLTKKYDPKTNYTNNIIGSYLNISPHIQLQNQLHLTEKISLNQSFGITHVSNGHITLPNLGINYFYASIGLNYKFKDKFKKDSFIRNEFSFIKNKYELSLLLGVTDRGTEAENHILPTYGIVFTRNIFTSDINTLKFGISAEYKNSDYDYKWFDVNQNTDLAIVVGDELFFGRVSLDAILGIYVYSSLAFEKKKYMYQRLGINYRLPLKTTKYGIIVGTHLKAHYGAAELTESRISFLF